MKSAERGKARGKKKKRHKPPAFGPYNPTEIPEKRSADGGGWWMLFIAGNQLNEMQRTINKSASKEDAPLAK